jgi:hypothetical protein
MTETMLLRTGGHRPTVGHRQASRAIVIAGANPTEVRERV